MAKIPESLIRQGIAARAALVAALEAQDAYLAHLEEISGHAEEDMEFPPIGTCKHPADMREDTSTVAGPSFFCRGCRMGSEEIKAAASSEGGK